MTSQIIVDVIETSAGEQFFPRRMSDVQELTAIADRLGGAVFVPGFDTYLADTGKDAPIDGGPIGRVISLSGTRSATQSSLVSRPVLSSGKLVFDGSNDYLNTNIPTTAAGHIFIAVRHSGAGAKQCTPVASSDGNSAGIALYRTQTTKYAGAFTHTGSLGAVLSIAYPVPDSQLLIQDFAWTAGTQDLRTYLCGVYSAATSSVASRNPATSTKAKIGKLGSATYYQNGSIAGIVWVPATVTAADQSLILDRLKNISGYKAKGLIVLGDSTVATYSSYSAVASYLTDSNSDAVADYFDLSVAGETIAQQKARFDAVAAACTLINGYVIVQVGLNDLAPAEAASVAIARYQDLVTAIEAKGAAVVVATMTPCKTRLISLYGASGPTAYQKWLDINTAITGGGASPITGQVASVSLHTTALNDGSGNLRSEYDTGDGIHENNLGRAIVADAWKAALVELGYL